LISQRTSFFRKRETGRQQTNGEEEKAESSHEISEQIQIETEKKDKKKT